MQVFSEFPRENAMDFFSWCESELEKKSIFDDPADRFGRNFFPLMNILWITTCHGERP